MSDKAKPGAASAAPGYKNTASVTHTALITWLRAQLDDDERAAGRISRAPMHGVESPAEKDYLRFADPARVRADVDAKRRVLELHSSPDPSCDECGYVTPCATVRLLALPYADRPGYRVCWAWPGQYPPHFHDGFKRGQTCPVCGHVFTSDYGQPATEESA